MAAARGTSTGWRAARSGGDQCRQLVPEGTGHLGRARAAEAIWAAPRDPPGSSARDGQQLVALRLCDAGSSDRVVAFRLHPLERSTRRLGPVAGVTRVALELGDRPSQGFELRLAGRLPAAGDCNSISRSPSRSVRATRSARVADRRILGGHPTALLLGQQPLGVALHRLLLEELDEPADVLLPTGFLTQPGDADLIDQLRNGGGGESGAELRVAVDDSPHTTECRGGQPRLLAEGFDLSRHRHRRLALLPGRRRAHSELEGRAEGDRAAGSVAPDGHRATRIEDKCSG